MGNSKRLASMDAKQDKRGGTRDVGVLSRLTLCWKRFWMWRLGVRMIWALILALLALLALIYLVAPVGDQAQVVAFSQAVIQELGQSLGATSMRIAMIAALAVGAGASMALLLSPASAKSAYRYLFPPTSVASYTTVLLDTENLVGNREYESLLREILDELKKTLLAPGGGAHNRTDLLFFMDARQLQPGTAVAPEGADDAWLRNLNRAYGTLIASGFRLINSPHNPTGAFRLKGAKNWSARGRSGIKEAADREIEFLAFERALLSKVKQKFVLISGDGDFAPLVYHLIALGHDVQIWKWGPTHVYDEMNRAIPSLVIATFPKPQHSVPDNGALDSQKYQPAPGGSSRDEAAPAQADETLEKFVFRPRPPAPTVFPQSGMNVLYYVIDNTAELCQSIGKLQGAVDEKLRVLQDTLNSAAMRRRLTEVGFSTKGASLSWRRILYAVDALRQLEDGFPARGAIAAPVAARRLFAMALAVARATASATRNLTGDVDLEAVRAQLVASDFASGETRALLTLVGMNGTGITDTHFLARCAQALKLLDFDETSEAPQLIKSPRLTILAQRLIQPEADGPVGAQPAE